MPVQPGQSLLHYRLVEKIGEGGMGVVWRGRDTKLDRDVAIKILPHDFAQNPDRLARFEREAKLLASLNHGNIATIHGLEHDAGVHFLAMELVEGEDLAARIERGAIPVEEALPLALQIASALEAAHERGVIHRDLKPQNIKVTPEDNVKVLDFGLAKAFGPDAQDPITSPTMSPTVTSAGNTAAGVILGTAAYMSPEQAKGKVVDKRTDVWAFGCLLFEMLSGRRSFGGDSVTETLSAVIRDEPDWDSLPPATPLHAVRLMRRCLVKDPKQRLRDIGDARLELLEVQSEPTRDAGIDAGERQRAWLPWTVAAASVVVALVIWQGGGEPSGPNTSEGLLKVRYATLPAYDGRNSRKFFLSPQGDRVVIEAPGRLLLRSERGLQPVVLVEGLAGDRSAPFWSPDGRWVAYANRGRLWKVPSGGGTPKMICSVPNNYNAGAWGADDRIVFVLTRGDIYSVSALGGNPELLLARVEGEDVDFHQPTFLPDGQSFVYSVHRPTGVDTIEVSTGGERRVVYRLEGELRLDPQVLNTPIYSGTGYLLYRRDAGNEGIWAFPFSVETMEATGDPFLVAGGGQWPSVSRDGRRLVYAETVEDSLSRLVRVAIDGSATTTIASDLAGLRRASISPAGDRIAFGAEVGSGRELFVADLAGQVSRLTSTPESEDAPTWSPDGTELYFQKGTGEGTAVYRMPVDGSASPEKVIDQASAPVLSRQGRRIVFSTNSRSILGIGYYDLDTGEETILLESSSDFATPILSPDGRVLAYTGWETGEAALSLRAFPDGVTSQTIPDSQETAGAWSPDGRTFYYWHNAEPKVMAVDIVSEPSVVVGPPRVALDLSAAGLPVVHRDFLAVFPDGKSFLMAQPIRPGEGQGDIILVDNWLTEFEGDLK